MAVKDLDEGGRPLPGYGREECLSEAFDSIQQVGLRIEKVAFPFSNDSSVCSNAFKTGR